MPSIIHTLEQGEWWYGQDGRPYRIEEMEQSHRINTLAFLRRRAAALQEHRAWVERELMKRAPDAVFDDWLHGLDEPAEQWLERRPLVQALDQAIKNGRAIPGSVIEIDFSRSVKQDDHGLGGLTSCGGGCCDPFDAGEQMYKDDDEDPGPRWVRVRHQWKMKYLLSTHKTDQVAHLLDPVKSFLEIRGDAAHMSLTARCGWHRFSWTYRGLGARLAETKEDRRLCPRCAVIQTKNGVI